MKNSYQSQPTLVSVLKEVSRGKSVSRTMTNIFWRGTEIVSGTVLDIGGAGRGSHYRFIPLGSGTVIKTIDISPKPGTDFVLDITRDRVPLQDSSADAVFLFNILEHVNVHSVVLAEAHRLLKPGGKILGSIPFLVNVHPDPHDYVRFTDEALRELFAKTGFKVVAIEAIGRGPFLAAYEQLDMLIWKPLHLIFLPLVWCLDGILQALRPKRDLKAQFPLAYDFIVEKKAI